MNNWNAAVTARNENDQASFETFNNFRVNVLQLGAKHNKQYSQILSNRDRLPKLFGDETPIINTEFEVSKADGRSNHEDHETKDVEDLLIEPAAQTDVTIPTSHQTPSIAAGATLTTQQASHQTAHNADNVHSPLDQHVQVIQRNSQLIKKLQHDVETVFQRKQHGLVDQTQQHKGFRQTGFKGK